MKHNLTILLLASVILILTVAVPEQIIHTILLFSIAAIMYVAINTLLFLLKLLKKVAVWLYLKFDFYYRRMI